MIGECVVLPAYDGTCVEFIHQTTLSLEVLLVQAVTLIGVLAITLRRHRADQRESTPMEEVYENDSR